MEGVLALMIPIVAVGGFFGWMISLSPMGKAIADRLRHGPIPRPGAGTPEEMAELVDSVDALRREVAELAERVDFTERLLGQQQAGAQLGRPRT
ncbi:MAG TPA: hypothetical protein VFM23_02710 [Gemmatimonadales bacterium]|nr:hypothetical protein [Gemmatimonadales bacterium]